ncbi:unnamed protein product [Hymenolepis diminuta]|uniref:Uncharacterized protein n=1 Tax=Hymenolepis diminuta TaxID=6216 RepID=A0A564YYN2_HYMDI|nr:unnamed protein product [Hymenolepis diminuta]
MSRSLITMIESDSSSCDVVASVHVYRGQKTNAQRRASEAIDVQLHLPMRGVVECVLPIKAAPEYLRTTRFKWYTLHLTDRYNDKYDKLNKNPNTRVDISSLVDER